MTDLPAGLRAGLLVALAGFVALACTSGDAGVGEAGRRSAIPETVAEAKPLPTVDLAVTAVDSEPARRNIAALPQIVSLLAAVENKGSAPASQVRVEARVTTDEGAWTLADAQQIDRLAPGETRLVRFSAVSTALLARSPGAYLVRVRVVPLDHETALDNNSREVQVRVRGVQ